MRYFPIAFIIFLLFASSCGRQGDSSQTGMGEDSAGFSDSLSSIIAKGQELSGKSEYDSALTVLLSGLKYERCSDSLASQLYGEISAAHLMSGRMDSAVKYGRTALALMKQTSDSASYVIMNGNIGIAYRRLGMNDSALACYRQGLDMALAIRDDESAAYLCNNLSVLYCELEHYDEALQYAVKAKESAEKCGEDVEYCSALANEGITYSKMGKDSQAEATLSLAYGKAQELNSLPLKLKLINHIIAVCLNSGKTRELEYYLGEGEKLSAALPSQSVAAGGILLSKANVLLKTGKYREALAAYNKIGDMKVSNQILPDYKLLEQQSKCYEGLGDGDMAYSLLRKSMEKLDSVRAEDSERQLSEYSVKFKTQEKELEIAELEQENLRYEVFISRLTLVIVGIVAVLIIITVYLLYRRRLHVQKNEILMSRKYIDGLESERSRLAHELHDGICNDLLALGMELRSEDFNKSAVIEHLEATRSDLRQISHGLIPPSFQYAGLDEILKDYCSHLTKPADLSISCDFEKYDWKNLPVKSAYEIYRIAQEAVANIIKHSGATKAVISLTHDNEGRVRFSISDNGAANTVNNSDSGGIGLQTIKDRANSIGASCSWKCGDGGSEWIIVLPLKSNDQ